MASKIQSPVCDLLGCTHPIVLAGMGGVARAELVDAVTQAGGFGLLDMVRAPPAMIRAEVARLRARTERPFGVNLIPTATDPALLEAQIDTCIELAVPVIGLFWDISPLLVQRLRHAGIRTVYQVGSVEEARKAQEAGADVLIAQGREAGGHVRGDKSLTALVSDIVAMAGVPVLAAGGIVDGADVAASLSLGAQGVVIGTALITTHESFAHAYHKQRLVDAGEDVGRLHTISSATDSVQRIVAETLSYLEYERAPLDQAMEIASPTCYAYEANDIHMGFVGQDELLTMLNELLEAERAGVRVTVELAHAIDTPYLKRLIEEVHHGEVRWCHMLTTSIRSMGGRPSTRTGEFYARATAIVDFPERLSFLNRGQGWVVSKLQALVPRIRDERIQNDLMAMLTSHQAHIEDVDAYTRIMQQA